MKNNVTANLLMTVVTVMVVFVSWITYLSVHRGLEFGNFFKSDDQIIDELRATQITLAEYEKCSDSKGIWEACREMIHDLEEKKRFLTNEQKRRKK